MTSMAETLFELDSTEQAEDMAELLLAAQRLSGLATLHYRRPKLIDRLPQHRLWRAAVMRVAADAGIDRTVIAAAMNLAEPRGVAKNTNRADRPYLAAVEKLTAAYQDPQMHMQLKALRDSARGTPIKRPYKVMGKHHTPRQDEKIGGIDRHLTLVLLAARRALGRTVEELAGYNTPTTSEHGIAIDRQITALVMHTRTAATHHQVSEKLGRLRKHRRNLWSNDQCRYARKWLQAGDPVYRARYETLTAEVDTLEAKGILHEITPETIHSGLVGEQGRGGGWHHGGSRGVEVFGGMTT